MAQVKTKRGIPVRSVIVEYPESLVEEIDRQANSAMMSRAHLLRQIAKEFLAKQGAGHAVKPSA